MTGGRFVEIGKRDIFSPARVAQERPDVAYGLVAVDFMPEPVLHSAMSRLSRRLASGVLRPLPCVAHGLAGGGAVAALRQMSQARHVGKVVITPAATPAASSSSSTSALPPVLPGGTVLITGGTGTLGALVAGWLAEQGARHFLLVGRTGRATAAAAPLLQAGTAAYGAKVTIAACDAGQAADMAGLLKGSADSRRPPVTVLIHAGGVLADATLGNHTLSTVRRVLAPKQAALARWRDAAGGLYPASSEVMFSSVASLLGAAGQANYSAANAALDGAARLAQWAGTPAVSLQWGAWAGGGMAAASDAQTGARVERMGMGLVVPQRGLAALEGEFESWWTGLVFVKVAAWPQGD